jgi:maltose O-acetyltransferase
MIEDAVREGLGIVDLLRGTESYKLEITSDSTRTWNVVIKKHQVRRTLAGMLWYIGEPLVHFWRRLARERLLLRVHFREHGFPSFLYRYLVFLMQRFRRIGKDRHLQKQERKSGKPQSPSKSLSEVIIAVLSRSRSSLLRRIARSLERDRYLPLRKKVRKGLVFLWSFAMSRLYLHAVDKLGRAARTRGRPYIDNLGRIMIGNGFNLNSRIVRSELATGPRGTIDIGDDVSINFGASISAQTKVKIGNRVRIGPYAMIIDSDFHTPGGDPYSTPTGQPITIEDDVWLGGRVTVLKGTTIGARSVITAGSVVTGIIPPDVIAGGVPARVLRRLRPAPEQGTKDHHSQLADDEITQRVKKVFVKTFRLAGSVDLSWGPSQIARWDSLGHLNLILALESEFGITMTEDDMLNIVSVRHACDIIKGHMRTLSRKEAKPS